MSLPTVAVNVNYERQKEVVRSFLENFQEESSDDLMLDDSRPKYREKLQQIANRETDVLVFELDDLFRYEKAAKTSGAKPVADCIAENTFHYIELISSVVDSLIPTPTTDVSYNDEVLEVILHHRVQRNQRIMEEMQQDSQLLNSSQPAPDAIANEMFPPELTRRYTLYFKPLTPGVRHPASPDVKKSLAVREVKSDHLGKLITVRGVVTRVSEVKPAVVVTAYTCDKCGNEVFQEVKSKQYTPLTECPSQECVENNSKGKLFPSTRASKFLPFQDVRLQEVADQVPVGHIPRSLTMHLKGPLVRAVKPGDSVDITGIFMPRPYSGFRALRAGLLTDTFLDVQFVHSLKQSYVAERRELDSLPPALNPVTQFRSEGNVYERLARSIAPEIYGHLDVKKALLLMLIGGVTKEMGDGMKIRGNLNMCLMGDPGVAKSQLLKFITKVASRGVYTTGRGSSGVGLTAAVIRDPVTDEMMLEGGALVLADNGVCCIDEFDKMDDSDRTAIHEVMEQQTISIAKAGMSTSLNARTSILAAANPVYGRYNPRLSPVENINLPAALLSRFDLMFLLLDTPTSDGDRMLAEHVAYVHRYSQAPSVEDVVSPELLRQYVAEAQEYRPVFPKEVADFVATSYVQMRQRHKRGIEEGNQFGYTSPRALLGIMRMAQALARLRFSNVVSQEDVDEALRLNEASKQSLQSDNAPANRESVYSKVYQIIVDTFSVFGTNSIPMSEVRKRVAHKGYTLDELNNTVRQYVDMGLFLHTNDDELEKV